MEKVKIKNIKTGVISEVAKDLASDFVGTKQFEIVKEIKKEEKPIPKKFGE